MIRFVVVAGAILAACLHDHYQCKVDSDCDLGSGGRCEIDHACTQYDISCPTERRYSAHSGIAGACYDGRVTPASFCAAGQPPALPVGCAARVCDAVPACCETGWSEACVIQAQVLCDEVRCDTRIALTATRGSKTELWELRFDGVTWTAIPHSEAQNLIAYLAPAPGETEPRLGAFVPPSMLAITGGRNGELDIPVDPNHDYHDLVSLDFDRDLRDTVVLDWQDITTGDQLVEITKLDTGATREILVGVSTREAWGDYDHDGYPDGVAAQGARYVLLNNLERADHQRDIDASITSNMSGSATLSAPSTRNFVWADVDGDHQLDLVAAGNSLRIHAGADRISDTPLLNIDCEPPAIFGVGACNTGSDSITDLASWAAAVIPNGNGGEVIAATDPTRKLYRIGLGSPPTFKQLALPAGSCPGCAYLAVFVRDLDGDHAPDIVAIDSELGLAVALSTNQMKFDELRPFTPINGPFTIVRASVTGAPR